MEYNQNIDFNSEILLNFDNVKVDLSDYKLVFSIYEKDSRINFNIEYDTFAWSPYRIIKNLGGKHLDQTATEKDLFFEIITVLDNEDFMSNPDMIPVKNYISDKFENIAREKKYTFATKLASLFVKYIDSNISDIEKPAQDDIIGKWNNILGKGIKEDNFEPLEFTKNNWDKIKEDNKDLFSSPASKFEFLIYTEILKPKIKKILDNETDTNISRLAILNKFDIESIKNSAEKDKIKLDEDILFNSAKDIETKVKYRESIGRSLK